MSRFTFICEDEPMPFSESIVSKKTVEFNGESLDDIINEAEDTLTILNKYVDSMQIQGDRQRLDNLIRNLYHEALSVE